MGQMIVSANDITRVFQNGAQRIVALSKVSMQIGQGQLTVLRGRSGSGKTCMINLLGALDKPTEGSVQYKGQEITRLPEFARDRLRRTQFGFVFQSVALVSTMTALENVEFALRLAGVPHRQRQARAQECLAFVGLEKRMRHRPHELSGGEQQRVAIARAIAHRPGLIFADEPTAELDSRMGLQIVSIFRELIDREGTTIVMTTHDPQMMELADAVYTLRDGVVTDFAAAGASGGEGSA